MPRFLMSKGFKMYGSNGRVDSCVTMLMGKTVMIPHNKVQGPED